jgi:hypothetical protein
MSAGGQVDFTIVSLIFVCNCVVRVLLEVTKKRVLSNI